MQRRHFLTIASSSLVIAGCSVGTTGVTVLDEVIADIHTIAGGLTGVSPLISNLTGFNADDIFKIMAAIADLQSLATRVDTVATIPGAQPIVQQIEADVNTIIGGLATIPVLPPPIAIAIQAINILLPIIELAVNLLVPAKITARAVKAQLTPDQARNILRDLAPHK